MFKISVVVSAVCLLSQLALAGTVFTSPRHTGNNTPQSGGFDLRLDSHSITYLSNDQGYDAIQLHDRGQGEIHITGWLTTEQVAQVKDRGYTMRMRMRIPNANTDTGLFSFFVDNDEYVNFGLGSTGDHKLEYSFGIPTGKITGTASDVRTNEWMWVEVHRDANALADVYINDQLLLSDINVTGSHGGSTPRFMFFTGHHLTGRYNINLLELEVNDTASAIPAPLAVVVGGMICVGRLLRRKGI